MRPASDSDPCRNNSGDALPGDALPTHEKPGGRRPAVREYAKDREQAGTGLDLVDDDQATERLERQHRLTQPGQVAWILQIEAGDPFPGGREFQGERSLADLTGTEKRHDRIVAQILLNSGQMGGPGDHYP